jgi:hypothetical protein
MIKHMSSQNPQSDMDLHRATPQNNSVAERRKADERGVRKTLLEKILCPEGVNFQDENIIVSWIDYISHGSRRISSVFAHAFAWLMA